MPVTGNASCFGDSRFLRKEGDVPLWREPVLSFLRHGQLCIHWQMMKDARDAGCLEYDFYGIAPEGQPSIRTRSSHSLRRDLAEKK